MLNKFNAFIAENHLCRKTDKVLLTVSGGIDSMVMAYLFFQAGFDFSVAHCNFSLRGAESDEDEQFVKHLTTQIFKKPFFSKKFDTTSFVAEQKISVQQAARELRYVWFEEIRLANKINCIATAHHLDDQIETFFINLLRGTGITGLAGIPLKQNHIIRPMLFTGRKEIEEYAVENKIGFRNDSSNQSDKYLRNKIRHHLFHLLGDLNPAYRDTITQSIQNLKNTEIIYKKHIQQLYLKKCDKEDLIKIEIKELKTLEPGVHYLFELINEYGFNRATCADIIRNLDGIPGKEFHSTTHTLLRDREHLIIYRKQNKMGQNLEFLIPQGTTEMSFPLELRFKELVKTDDMVLNQGEDIAMVDLDRLTFPLIMRPWKEGDYFYPLGMKTPKKISDFFIDNKLSIHEKSNTWLLISCGEIVWVVGHRIDERYKIRSKTNNIFMIEKL